MKHHAVHSYIADCRVSFESRACSWVCQKSARKRTTALRHAPKARYSIWRFCIRPHTNSRLRGIEPATSSPSSRESPRRFLRGTSQILREALRFTSTLTFEKAVIGDGRCTWRARTAPEAALKRGSLEARTRDAMHRERARALQLGTRFPPAAMHCVTPPLRSHMARFRTRDVAGSSRMRLINFYLRVWRRFQARLLLTQRLYAPLKELGDLTDPARSPPPWIC